MRSATLDLVFLTALFAGTVYFGVDAWLGASGDVNSAPLREEIRTIEADIIELEQRREALEDKVGRLTGSEIDAELLDERLRAAFGVIAEDERLILEPEAERPLN